MSESCEDAQTLAKLGRENCEFAHYLLGKIRRACVQGTGKGSLCSSMWRGGERMVPAGESVGRAGKGRTWVLRMGSLVPRTDGREMYVAGAMGHFASNLQQVIFCLAVYGCDGTLSSEGHVGRWQNGHFCEAGADEA